MNNFLSYSKTHKIVMSYADAEKYIKVGWTLENVRKVLLRGINIEYDECTLVWKKSSPPVMPTDLD